MSNQRKNSSFLQRGAQLGGRIHMAQKMGGTFLKGRNRSLIMQANIKVSMDTPL